MGSVTQILNWISNSLLLPVIVLLLATLAASLVSLGGFCSNYLALLRERRKHRELLGRIRSGAEPDRAALDGEGVFAEHLAELIDRNWDELECEKIISEHELAYERELDRSRFLAKVAPMLGLMGTLIPMGPALAGLASGDIANMAYNMQIAFATTVLGCCIAGISILVLSVRKHDYADEIACLQYVLDRHQRKAAI